MLPAFWRNGRYNSLHLSDTFASSGLHCTRQSLRFSDTLASSATVLQPHPEHTGMAAAERTCTHSRLRSRECTIDPDQEGNIAVVSDATDNHDSYEAQQVARSC